MALKALNMKLGRGLVLAVYKNTSLNTAFKIPWIHFVIMVVK